MVSRVALAVAAATGRSSNSDAPVGVANMDSVSAATIHLKNRRTIHAETAKEAGDKVEYTIGESVFQVTTSLVLEGPLRRCSTRPTTG